MDTAFKSSSIGNIYNEQGAYDKALTVLQYGKQIKKEIGDKKGLANAYSLIGKVMLNKIADTLDSLLRTTQPNPQNNLSIAINYLDSAIIIDKEMGYLDNMQQSYKSLSEAQNLHNDYKAAFASYKQYSLIKDSVFSLEKQTDIFNLLKKEEIEDQKRPQVIDILSTFSVLIIFEFINLLIHGKIEALTHHNLVLTLMCLLGIAAIIIPLHHRMEHWVKKKIGH